MEGESLLVFQTHQTLRLFCFHILTTPSSFTNGWKWMKMNANGCKRINRCKMMIDEDFVEKGFTWTNLINLILFKKYYNIWNGALLSHIKVSVTQSIIDLKVDRILIFLKSPIVLKLVLILGILDQTPPQEEGQQEPHFDSFFVNIPHPMFFPWLCARKRIYR